MVWIQKCPSYDREQVLERMQEIFEKHGGLAQYAGPGRTVVIKPNLVGKKRPEEAATTHPSLVWAAALLCRRAGARVIIAESPGGLYEKSFLKAVYRTTGMEEAAADSGAELNYDLREIRVENPQARYLRSPEILAPLAEADTVINISKLKTHGMMVYTGAVKNMFGAVAGLKKAEYHMKMSDYDEFANALIDIFLSTRVSLNIIDAVVGMERDGPTAGDPREMGLLLSGRDAFLTDLTALKIIGTDPSRVPILKNAAARGLCPTDTAQIDYMGGLTPEETAVAHFAVNYNEQFANLHFLKGAGGRWLSAALRPRPVFHKKKCRACHECEKCCPAKVIVVTKEHGARADLNGCIRCYCCQELCPFHAVTIKKPLINKLFIRGGRRSE